MNGEAKLVKGLIVKALAKHVKSLEKRQYRALKSAGETIPRNMHEYDAVTGALAEARVCLMIAQNVV